MAARSERSHKEREPKRRSVFRDVIACILPILSLGLSLTIGVLVFSRVQDKVMAAQEAMAGAAPQPSPANAEPAPVYAGVEDPWITSGSFTVGTSELDDAIKTFCDQHTATGATQEEAAQATFDAIVQSTYVDMLEKPSGTNWVHRAAQMYFSYLKTTEGEPEGDYYEFAAVTALCLRYFGYSDAIAVPVLHAMDNGGQYGGALCIVSNTDGVPSVCDPALGTSGWMLKRAGYKILVDDIGQDLSTAQGLGLEIQLSPEHQKEADATGVGTGTGTGTGTTGTGAGTTGTGAGTATGTGTGYGYDEYGYDEYGYDEYDSTY